MWVCWKQLKSTWQLPGEIEQPSNISISPVLKLIATLNTSLFNITKHFTLICKLWTCIENTYVNEIKRFVIGLSLFKNVIYNTYYMFLRATITEYVSLSDRKSLNQATLHLGANILVQYIPIKAMWYMYNKQWWILIQNSLIHLNYIIYLSFKYLTIPWTVLIFFKIYMKYLLLRYFVSLY